MTVDMNSLRYLPRRSSKNSYLQFGLQTTTGRFKENYSIDTDLGNVQFKWPKFCQVFPSFLRYFFFMNAFSQSFQIRTCKHYAY